jgi:hypothetical protein
LQEKEWYITKVVAFEVKGKVYEEKPNIMQNLTKNKDRKIQQNTTTIQKVQLLDASYHSILRILICRI